MSVISTGIDYYLAYKFIQKLITPFDKTEAFKLGIIDKDGKVLKKRSALTSKEGESYKLMDTLAFNLKKILAKLPGGKSKIATLAAALLLLKEGKKYKSEEDLVKLEEDFKYFINSEICYNLLMEYKDPVNKYLCEASSAPTTAAGDQAGLDDNPPGPRKFRKFAGARIFRVPTSTFMKARFGKKKYKRYRRILGEIENGEEIRQYGRRYYKRPIILQDEQTGAMLYLRYGKVNMMNGD